LADEKCPAGGPVLRALRRCVTIDKTVLGRLASAVVGLEVDLLGKSLLGIDTSFRMENLFA